METIEKLWQKDWFAGFIMAIVFTILIALLAFALLKGIQCLDPKWYSYIKLVACTKLK